MTIPNVLNNFIYVPNYIHPLIIVGSGSSSMLQLKIKTILSLVSTILCDLFNSLDM